MRTPNRKRKQFGRTVLFSPAIAIQNIEEYTVQTEYALQKFVSDWVEETKQVVKDKIEELDVVDTGATKESVYGVFPIAQSRQRIVSGNLEKQKIEVSTKSLEEYQRASYLAKQRRRSLATVPSSQINPRTGRIKEGGEASTLTSPLDAPLNPIGTVTRKNLYGGVGILTWYAIYPHDGLGFHGVEQGGKGPRDFFVTPVREEQLKLVKKLPILERTIRGRMRIKK